MKSIEPFFHVQTTSYSMVPMFGLLFEVELKTLYTTGAELIWPLKTFSFFLSERNTSLLKNLRDDFRMTTWQVFVF